MAAPRNDAGATVRTASNGSSACFDGFLATFARLCGSSPGKIQDPAEAQKALPSLDEIGLRYLDENLPAAEIRLIGLPGEGDANRRGYRGGDKTSSGQNFCVVYDELFSSSRSRSAAFRFQPGLRFLEVGVFYGKYLAMFADYFV